MARFIKNISRYPVVLNLEPPGSDPLNLYRGAISRPLTDDEYNSIEVQRALEKRAVFDVTDLLPEELGPNALIYLGVIYTPEDFPTPEQVFTGACYRIGADVEDNDPTRTNTGIILKTYDEIFWDEDSSNWVIWGGPSSGLPADVVRNPSLVGAAGNVTIFNGTATEVQDSGIAVADVVLGPAVAVDENLAVYDGVTGKLIKDSAKSVNDVVMAASIGVTSNIPIYSDVTGRLITDSGVGINDVTQNTMHRNTVSGNPHNVLAVEITDFDVEVSNNVDVSANTTHRNTVTGNPHDVLAVQITDFDVEVANNADVSANTVHRSSDGTDHSDVVLNNGHRATVTGNPHDVLATQISDFDTEVENNADVDANTTHRNTTTGNPHNVLAVEITDFDTEVANNADVDANTTHRNTVIGNPHNVLATQVTDFDAEVANNADVSANTTHRTSDGTDHSHVVLNDNHRAATGNPHSTQHSELGGIGPDDHHARDHNTTHISGGADTIPNAVASVASGLMSAADKTKLDALNGNATEYLVGPDTYDPYSSISGAIAQAVIDGHGPANKAIVLVKPGDYTENVTLQPGIAVCSLSSSKEYAVRIFGQVTVNCGAGTLLDNLCALIGVSVSHDGSAPSIHFTGTNPQQLRFINAEVNSPGAAAALRMDNTDATSFVVFENANANNTSTGYAAHVEYGKLSSINSQTNASAAANVSVYFDNGGQSEMTNHYSRGQIMFAAAGGGGLFGTAIIDAGANPAIRKDSAAALLTSDIAPVGGGALIGGAAPASVVNMDKAVWISYSTTVGASWAGAAPTDVLDALDRIAQALSTHLGFAIP